MSTTPKSEDVIKARAEYTQLGFDTLPLPPGEKKMPPTGWQYRLPLRMWLNYPPQANIGIRAGGDAGLGILDLDDAQTVERARAFMAGLGYMPEDYPEVESASGVGRHFYVTLTDNFGGQSSKFIKTFGDGEFKHGQGSYAVAPPSEVDGAYYRWLAGDLRQLPKITSADILPILNPPDPLQSNSGVTLGYPRSKATLIHGDPVAIATYQSQSEGDQAILQSLYNIGWTFEDALGLFCTNPCAGHFAELYKKSPKQGIAWLHRSYEKAARYGSTHESKNRQDLKVLIRQARSRPWPGRTGSVDRDVYLAILSTGSNAGTYTVQASTRSLAEKAGVSHPTAGKAALRIIKAGLVSLEVPATLDFANVYQIKPRERNLPLPHIGSYEEVVSYVPHDVFRRHGLGKTAEEIWEAIQRGPMTDKEMAAATGRHYKTIRRTLRKMANQKDTVTGTGEFIPMVIQGEDGKWKASPGVDLDLIAKVIGTDGTGKRQQYQHAAERRAHARGLLKGRKK